MQEWDETIRWLVHFEGTKISLKQRCISSPSSSHSSHKRKKWRTLPLRSPLNPKPYPLIDMSWSKKMIKQWSVSWAGGPAWQGNPPVNPWRPLGRSFPRSVEMSSNSGAGSAILSRIRWRITDWQYSSFSTWAQLYIYRTIHKICISELDIGHTGDKPQLNSSRYRQEPKCLKIREKEHWGMHWRKPSSSPSTPENIEATFGLKAPACRQQLMTPRL